MLGLIQVTGQFDEMSDLMDMTSEAATGGVLDMIIRFIFNMLVVAGISRYLYYPKGRRRDYLFVFVIISISIFLMVYLLGSLKLKIGFALGLFAIFGIIRYRTEQMPVREMTYLFVIIALSVVNALSASISVGQLLIANGLLVAAVWLSERQTGLASVKSKLIVYDRVDIITPEHKQDLMDDLSKRTGLKVVNVEVGSIDYMKDTAMVRIYFEDENMHSATDLNSLRKLPREV